MVYGMEEAHVLVIGAGIAGLTAARELSQTGVAVKLLEGRERLGGRIRTINSQPGDLPIELGAEFVHGAQNELWPMLREAALGTRRVPDRHWRASRDSLQEMVGFWQQLSAVTERINTAAPDQDCQSFLDQAWSVSTAAKKLTRDFVEGFHAAPANRLSIHALAKAEEAAEKEKGTVNYRLRKGYNGLVQWLADELGVCRVEVLTNTLAKRIRWEPGHVEVLAQTPAGQQTFHAARLLVTVPLGVLQEPGPAALDFEPRLPAKERAIQGLGMGAVFKLTLRFTKRFWPVENFGFIHGEDLRVPTWWADERGVVLTGWAGGPRADQLARESPEEVLCLALQALSSLFKVEPERLRDLLLGSYSYNWEADPFSRGAYSYTPVGMSTAVARLATPVAGTLFFAGEATNTEGDQGTVHGAAATGKRAAREILEAEQSSGLVRAELEMS